MTFDLIEYLKTNLKIEVTCDSDYLGTPEVYVVLLLDGEKISESTASIPEHRHDPDW
jgi:hypothetical protein